MKKFIATLLLLLPISVFASAGVELYDADADVSDIASLERGAKHYVTYCLGCHAIKYIRYKKLALDFKIDEKEILKDVAPLNAGIYDQMHSAMDNHDSAKWFGTTPPDLSLIARSRGADWLYSYLKGFYTDPKRPFGVNNRVFEDVGMPNVLWQLQGEQEPVYETVDGKEVIDELNLKQPGKMTEKEFDFMVNDIVNFLVYVAEPGQLERQAMGKYVLFFIFMFFVLAYLLKKEYWKDVD